MLSRTDRLVIAAISSIYFVFIINAITARFFQTWLVSTALLYFGVLVAGGIFFYCIIKLDPFKLVRDGLIIGTISGIIYSGIDTLFSEKLLIIIYLRPDIHPYTAAPLSLILIWFLAIVGLVYFYQRMNSFFQKVYIPSLLTGILVFFMSVTLGQLAAMARLWNWNRFWNWFSPHLPSIFTPFTIVPPFIGQVLLSVPVGLFISFLFSGFFVSSKNAGVGRIGSAIIGGIRCGIVIAMGQFISHFVTYLVMQKVGR